MTDLHIQRLEALRAEVRSVASDLATVRKDIDHELIMCHKQHHDLRQEIAALKSRERVSRPGLTPDNTVEWFEREQQRRLTKPDLGAIESHIS